METPESGERVALGRLWWVGPLVVIASVVANQVVRAIAVPAFGISDEFRPIAPGQVAQLTVVGTVAAVAVFAVIGRLSGSPIRLFQIVAVATLLVSFVPDLALLIAQPFPATTVQAVGSLMLMHVVAAAITVGLLSTLAREA